MKMLHTKVNIVPVIAKADCLTKFEMQRLKRKVSGEIFSECKYICQGIVFFSFMFLSHNNFFLIVYDASSKYDFSS